MTRLPTATALLLLCCAAVWLTLASFATTPARAGSSEELSAEANQAWVATHAADLRREHPHLSDRAIIQMAERERELALDTALARHQRDTDVPGPAPELSTPDERLELRVRGTVSPDRADRLPARRR